MPSSTSHKSGHSRGAHGSGQGDGGSHGEGGGGGGGGGGKLVKVAFARNQSEAELLQGLLLDSGIPSVLKRSGGFDNPDFLAAGPHDVWVSVQHEEEAKRVLAETMVADEDEDEGHERLELEEERRLARGEGAGPTPARLALWVVGAAIAAILLIWVLYEIS
jgi:Putative prokaryotic signal transducing protein